MKSSIEQEVWVVRCDSKVKDAEQYQRDAQIPLVALTI